MKKSLIIFISIMLLIPLHSFAITIGGGGSPPPPFQNNCGFDYQLSNDDNIFQDYQNIEYINGLLTIHLKANSSPAGYNNINQYLELYDSNCNKYFYYADFAQDPALNIPPNTEGISLRFTSATHFQVWNDDFNQQLNCDQCDVELSSYGFPSGLRASFHLQLNDYADNKFDWVYSEGFPVQDPNVQQKTPVLIVPGTLGTEIDKGSEVLWPDIRRMINPVDSDSFMDPLAFNPDGTPLDTSLTMPGILREPYPGQHFYDGIIQSFEDQGYQENKDLFVFPYDWREDIAKVAHNDLEQGLPLDQRTDLASKIDQILLDTGASKVDIVAHSQGGLVTKRLLFDNPEYQAKIRKLVLVGVPNLGSPQSAKILLYGDNLNIAKTDGIIRGQLDPQEIKKIGQNMPAVYQLLPSPSYFIHEPSGYIDDYNQFYLNTYQKTADYLKQNNLNSTLIDNAATFHNFNYDNFDFSTTGIQTFNIAGCEQGTLGTLVTKANSDAPGILFTGGDGTVPLSSAKQVVGVTSYYVQGAVDHSKMLSNPAIMPLATDLITGVLLPLPSGVVTDPSQCQFDGTEVTIHSPVDLDVYDENGSHIGVSGDDNNPFVDLGVPGAQYEEIGHNKYAYLPAGHTYTVKLTATDKGSFSFDSSQIQNGEVMDTAHYDVIPITASSTAEIDLNSVNNQTIQLDTNGDGANDATVSPSSILNAAQSNDLTPPISTSTITGIMGQSGYYRSNATITLSSIDPIVNNDPSQTSGVLKMSYTLDNNATTTYQSPITITSEGQHTISFFSTDNAGNNETAQTISFTIDKTPPEFIIQFNPSIQDLQFTATDTIPTTIASTSIPTKIKPRPPVRVVDSDNTIVATDAAGNTAEIDLADKNRKKNMRANIQALLYNGIPQDISNTVLKFNWSYDKNPSTSSGPGGNLTTLEQHVKSKKNFNIDAVYTNNQTTLSGKDQAGKINRTLSGLTLLKVSTNQGDFGWGY